MANHLLLLLILLTLKSYQSNKGRAQVPQRYLALVKEALRPDIPYMRILYLLFH